MCGITTLGSSGLQLPSNQQSRVVGKRSHWWSTPTDVKTIDTIEIATKPNATDFGDLVQTGNLMGSGASATRGGFFGGFIKLATQMKYNM